MKLFKAILAGLACVFIVPNCPAVQMQTKNWYGLENELPVIVKAAERNNCNGKLFSILLAIRKAENGPAGLEFGVIAVKDTNLETQARWAAATVVKNYQRYLATENTEEKIIHFIDYLADRYCPAAIDPVGNKNWKRNVLFWFEKFDSES